MSLRRWLRSLHAVTALALMVLFFAVAASAGAGRVYAGVELGSGVLSHVRGRGLIMMALVCLALIGAGLVVLWSLLPRFDRFVAPGPELLPAEHPALFREIERVAAMTFERARPAGVCTSNARSMESASSFSPAG